MEEQPLLICQWHQQNLTLYCQNENCPINKRIYCYKCEKENPQHQNHQTTDIRGILDEAKEAINQLEQIQTKINDQFIKVSSKTSELTKDIKGKTDSFHTVISEFGNQTKSQLLNAVKLAAGIRKLTIIELHKPMSLPLPQPLPLFPPLPSQICQICELNQDMLNNYQQQLEQNKNVEAIKILETILEFNPDNIIYKKERERLQSLPTQYQSDAKIMMDCTKALALFKQKKYQESFDMFIQVIRANFNNQKAHYHAGVCLSRLRKYNESISYFDNSITLSPNNPEALFEKSQSLFYLMDVVRLESCYLEMERISHVRVRLIQGQILMLRNELYQAISHFDRMIAENEKDYDAQYYKAYSLIMTRESKKIMLGNTLRTCLQMENYDIEKLEDLTRLAQQYQKQ